MQVKPIQKASTVSKVFEALYEMIASGQFRSGHKLPSQDDLARQFGVSRNTLREAVNKLSAMGLLTSQQGIGMVVQPPTPSGYLNRLNSQFLLDPLSVREFVEARICIERTAVRLAVARASREDIRSLREILDLQQAALKSGDGGEFTLQDAAFHMELARLSGNRVLVKFLQTIYDMLQRFIGEVSQLPGAIRDAFRFHMRLTDAIAEKDADRAEKEMALHLFDVVRRIESNLGVDLAQESLCGFELVSSGATAQPSSHEGTKKE